MVAKWLRCMGLTVHSGLATVIVGDPGSGKSRQIEQLAHAVGRECVTLIPALQEPLDIRGADIPDLEHGRVVQLAPPFASRINENAKDGKLTVLFIDEASQMNTSQQAATMRLALDLMAGDTQIDKRTAVFMAMNDVDTACGGFEFTPPMANRVIWLKADAPSAGSQDDDWIGYMNGHGITDDQLVIVTDEQVEQEMAKAVAITTAFVKRRGAPWEDPRKVEGRKPFAFCTRRTFTAATRIIAAALASKMEQSSELADVLAGCIGEPVARELIVFMEALDLPDPEAVLDGTVDFEHDPARSDRTFVVMNAVGEIAGKGDVKKKSGIERWKRAAAIIAKVGIESKQNGLVSIAVRSLCRQTPKDFYSFPETQQLKKVMGEFIDAIAKAEAKAFTN